MPGETTTLGVRQGILPFFQVSGENGGRFATGRIVLAQEAFEPEKPSGVGKTCVGKTCIGKTCVGKTWRRLVAGCAGRCIKLGRGLALVQVSLRRGRAR